MTSYERLLWRHLIYKKATILPYESDPQCEVYVCRVMKGKVPVIDGDPVGPGGDVVIDRNVLVDLPEPKGARRHRPREGF